MDQVMDGLNDFDQVYPSIAREKKLHERKELLEQLLEALDRQTVENLRVSATGEIVRTKEETEHLNQQQKAPTSSPRPKGARLVNMDDLPKEGELNELLFGRPGKNIDSPENIPTEKPAIEFQTARRVADGKAFHRLYMNRFPWEFLIIIGMLSFACFFLYLRMRRLSSAVLQKRRSLRRKKSSVRQESHLDSIDLREMIRGEIRAALAVQTAKHEPGAAVTTTRDAMPLLPPIRVSS